MTLAHRVAWELVHGPIADDLCVLHRCDNRLCVNVEHLFLGTRGDNIRDASVKGRARNQNSGKTHCLRGHPLTPDNTYFSQHGGRQFRCCKQCRRERRRIVA